MMGVFTEWQGKYAAAGIATVPIDPETKLFRGPWNKIGFPASTALTRKTKYQDCNGIGFACGPRSGITDVDVDAPDPELLQETLRRHGESPIVIQTASGKFHIWYRHNGERRSVRKLASLSWGRDVPIDILGGGLSVAPPTTNSKGQYRFVRGSLEDVQHLPTLRGLDTTTADLVLPDDVRNEEYQDTSAGALNGKTREGERNNTLFSACLKHARQAREFNAVLRFAMEMNAQFEPPLSEAEATQCAVNAWNRHDRNRNFFGSRSFVIPATAYSKLEGLDGDVGDALHLLLQIERAHWDRDEFVLAQAFAAVLGWSVRRFLRARDMLLRAGFIFQLTSGGRFKGDAPLFAWPSVSRGRL
jgi:hypothetical protein